MIFAAGLGTRLKPFTQNKPKALAQVAGIPLLEIVIRNLQKFGINEFVINVHHFAAQITDFLRENNNFGSKVYISDETDLLLDTGGGFVKAKPFFSNHRAVLIHNVDILSDTNINDLLAYHFKNEALVTLAMRKRKTSRYLVFDADNQLCEWRNEKTGQIKVARNYNANNCNMLAYSGIQVIDTEIFNHITETGVFSIFDMHLRLATTHKIIAWEHNNPLWLDLGTPENLAQAELFVKNLL